MLVIMGFMIIHNALPHTHHQHTVASQESHAHAHSTNQAHHHHDVELAKSTGFLWHLFFQSHVHLPHTTSEHPVITSGYSSLFKQKIQSTIGAFFPLSHALSIPYFSQKRENTPQFTHKKCFLRKNYTLRGPPQQFS